MLAASAAEAEDSASRAPAGSVVALELAEPLSTETAKRGDTFAIRLARPIMVGDTVVVPAGAVGRGEVIDAKSGVARIGKGARPSKLLLAARYIEYKGRKIPLRGFHLGAAVINQASWGVATSAAIVTFNHGPGGDAVLPIGAPGEAKLAADLDLSGQVIAAPSASPAPESSNASPPM